MGLIDTHSHLHAADFDQDRDEVLARARDAGVDTVFLVGEDAPDNERVLALCARHPECVPCLGLHPDRFAGADLERVLEQIREHAAQIVAVGEVGLDYWRAQEEADRATQRRLLGAFVALAREQDLTMNVHSRSAGHHTLEFLREQGAQRVHMHAFDGRAHFAEAAAAQGVFFSVPPSLHRSPQKQKLARRLPLESLLLESDAPVLGPEAGVRNEPANLAPVLEWLAQERGVPPDELRGLLEANTHRAYPRLAPWRAQRGRVAAALAGWLCLAFLLLGLLGAAACRRAPEPGPRDPLSWEDLDPAAQGYLVGHPVFQGFLVPPAVPGIGFAEVLEIVRQDRDRQVAATFDPVLPEWFLCLAEISGGEHRRAAERMLALARQEEVMATLQALRDRDPGGFRRRLVRAYLARVGEDPDTCTPDRLEEHLMATQAHWVTSELPLGAVQLRGRPEADSLARVRRILALAEQAGGLGDGRLRILWLEPQVDVVDPVLGARTRVLVPEPLLLAGSLQLGQGRGPGTVSLVACHPDVRVVELMDWTVRRVQDGPPLKLLLHESDDSADRPLATTLEEWARRGVAVSPWEADAIVGARGWEVQVPETWAQGLKGLCADPVVDRVAAADAFDLVVCAHVLEGLPGAVEDLLLTNLRRLCRPGGLLVTTQQVGAEDDSPPGWQQAATRPGLEGAPWFAYRCVKKEAGPGR